MGKTLLAAIIALTVLSLPASAVLAQSPSPTAKERRVETFGLKNCEALKNRVKGRLAHYKRQKENHLAKYNRILTRGEKVVAILTEKGYDAAKLDQLEADLDEFELMVAKFETDADAAIAKMEEALALNCGTAEQSLRSTLEEAKALLGTVRSDIQAIKDFVKNTLRADIRALKTANPKRTKASPSPAPSP